MHMHSVQARVLGPEWSTELRIHLFYPTLLFSRVATAPLEDRQGPYAWGNHRILQVHKMVAWSNTTSMSHRNTNNTRGAQC